jgi:transcriptional regulator with XRE-family HTH domain
MNDVIPPLLPAQVRAARALLGWSQQELASQASVATSTVADFERSQRSPVPNNLEAMRSALEGAGISFPAGGAVAGPTPSIRLRSNVTSERLKPVRWVTETDLAHWADRRDGQAMLPELVRRLILAERGYFPELRFASGESVQMHGWDGECRVDSGGDQIPGGWSGWELGTDQGPKRKADKDYKQRTKDALHLNPAETTFVFVTPRRWAEKQDWVKERRAEKHWATVRAYDAVDLVQWIERFPGVGLWLAKLIEKAPADVRELTDVWREWSLSTKPPLSAALVLADRDDEATRVLRWLYGEPAVMAVQAEAPGEAIAFLYAAIEQLPVGYRDFFHTRAVVAADADTARSLADVPTPLIIILDEPDAGLSMHLVEKGHYVYIAFGSEVGTPTDIVTLKRPTRYAVEHELLRMGFERHEAQNFAHDSARSLAILRRLIPSAPGYQVPDWAAPEAARALLPALLAGAWDESQLGDRTILEELAGIPYDRIATALTPFLLLSDSPLRKAGGTWKIASPRDAWFRVARNVTSTDLDRFAKAADAVLTSADPRFNMAPDERWMAGIKGQKPAYSALLRTGISETLVLLGVFGNQVATVPHAADSAVMIVRKLLQKADAVRWWSLSHQLQVLAEASPEEFMDAVEDSLAQNDPPIMALFVEGDGIFGTAYHANLLWALETLAWSLDYLARATNLLARLTALDRGGKWVNRPGNSLRQIYLLWHPQTSAPLQGRLSVLKQLRKVEPDVAWRLLLDLYPKAHDSTGDAPVPRWRDFSVEQPEPLTNAIIYNGAAKIGAWLLEDVGLDTYRWKQLINRFGELAPDLRRSAVKLLAASVTRFADDDSRSAMQQALRNLLHHHRQFGESDWALPPSELAEIERVYLAFVPVDPVKRIAWLFEQEQAPLPNPMGHDWQLNEKVSNEARQNAIKELFNTGGIAPILALAQSAKFSGLVGKALAETATEDITDAALVRAIQADDDQSWNFAHGIIFAFNNSKGEGWSDHLIDRAFAEGWKQDALLRILLSLPKLERFMRRVSEIGGEVEHLYWKRIGTLRIQGSPDTISWALDKLLWVGRGREALHLAGHHLNGLSNDQLVRILDSALRSDRSAEGDNNEAVMFQYHVEQIFGKLDAARYVGEVEMARLEWSYLNVLQSSKRPPKMLHDALSASPEFFIEVLSVIYRPHADDEKEELPEEERERSAAIATHAYRLLREWHQAPGKSGDVVDGKALEEWVKKARILAEKAGRVEAADQHIGRVLAYSPADPDGTWPCTPVRDVIELTRSRSVERGMFLGVVNKRGPTWRRPTDGGILERDLAQSYRNLSKSLRLEWPRTSALLERVAKSLEHQGAESDDDAERGQW